MPAIEALKRIAQAYMQRERAKLGYAAEDRTAQASETDDLVKRAQLARLTQQMGFASGDRDLDARYKESQIRQNEAHANYYETPKRTSPAKAVERTVDYGDRIRTFFTDGTTSDEPKGAAPKAPGSGGTGLSKSGIQIVRNGRPEVWFPPSTGAPLPDGASFATDVRNERKTAVAATSPLNNVEVLANQVEAALGKFEQTSMWHPVDKAVAQTTYKSQLEALAVPWGRLLGDSRISDQDRQAYAKSVGEPSFFLKEMAPEIARERLGNLRQIIAEVRQKYGPILEDTEGMYAGVGGGIDHAGQHGKTPAPGGRGVSPNVQRILDLMKARNGGR